MIHRLLHHRRFAASAAFSTKMQPTLFDDSFKVILLVFHNDLIVDGEGEWLTTLYVESLLITFRSIDLYFYSILLESIKMPRQKPNSRQLLKI